MLVVTGWTWTSTPVDHHKMVWSRQSCSKTWSWETCHQTSSVVSRNCLWKNCQQFKWLSGCRPHFYHICFLCLHQKFESWEFWKSNSRFVGWMIQLCWATRAQNVIQMFYQLAPVVPKRSQILYSSTPPKKEARIYLSRAFPWDPGLNIIIVNPLLPCYL